MSKDNIIHDAEHDYEKVVDEMNQIDEDSSVEEAKVFSRVRRESSVPWKKIMVVLGVIFIVLVLSAVSFIVYDKYNYRNSDARVNDVITFDESRFKETYDTDYLSREVRTPVSDSTEVFKRGLETVVLEDLSYSILEVVEHDPTTVGSLGDSIVMYEEESVGNLLFNNDNIYHPVSGMKFVEVVANYRDNRSDGTLPSFCEPDYSPVITTVDRSSYAAVPVTEELKDNNKTGENPCYPMYRQSSEVRFLYQIPENHEVDTVTILGTKYAAK